MQTSDIAIIGCGPAGLSAAIQLRRLGEAPLVFEAYRVGGLLVNAYRVENYPGFPEGIGGPELVSLMERQFECHAPEVIFEKVTRLDLAGGGSESAAESGSATVPSPGDFHLTTSQREVACRIVLVASGTEPREPAGLSIPDDVSGRVFSEVYPIWNVRDRHIVIVGSGDAAFDYAINLSGKNKVSVLNRGHETKCLPLLRDRAAGIDSIEYHNETIPAQLEQLEDDSIGVRCNTPQGSITVRADIVLFAIGREPNLDFVTERLAARIDSLKHEGLLHLIGDVGRGMMRQTAVATGDGVRAAMEAHKKLMELRA